MKVSYTWLKEYVGEAMPSEEHLEQMLTFHAFEVDGVEQMEHDTVFDIKVLPDRAADCLSHRGIAREIASLIPMTLVYDPLYTQKNEIPETAHIRAIIEDGTQCARISFALITEVKVTESPQWLKDRLGALGQRSINNIVDATNYVMYAIGQPLHAYDAQRITQQNDTYVLDVRMARAGETITTLSNETYTLDADTQLIVDDYTDQPLSLAGVKGGSYAEIHTDTTAIILEAGNFNPQTTRKTAQKLKLPTDAAKRFENNVSPEMVSPALREVVALILDIAGGVCEGKCDVYSMPLLPEKITLLHVHCTNVLGITISEEVIEDILARIGCIFEVIDGGWRILPPRERLDLIIPEDVIAEIGRIYGYEHIPARSPQSVTVTEYNARQEYTERIRQFLIERGFSEVITSSFCARDEVVLLNALASDKGALRSTLRHNIEDVLTRNVRHSDLLGVDRILVFEIGTVFHKDEKIRDVVEYTACSLGVRTKVSGYTPKDDTFLKEVITELEAFLGVSCDGVLTQGVYECNLSAVMASLPIPTSYTSPTKRTPVTFKPYSMYPFVRRDIAVWAGDGVNESTLHALIRAHGSELLVRLDLFDTFSKEGKTSYAFRLIFQSFDRTLTDEEVSRAMQDIEYALISEGCTIR